MDESNFRTGEHWRKLNIMVTCVDTGVTYSSSLEGNSISDHQRVSGRLSQRKVLNELSSWFATNRRLHSVGSNHNLRNSTTVTHDESNTNSNSHTSGISAANANILSFLNSGSSNDSSSDSSSTGRSQRSKSSHKSNRSQRSNQSSRKPPTQYIPL